MPGFISRLYMDTSDTQTRGDSGAWSAPAAFSQTSCILSWILFKSPGLRFYSSLGHKLHCATYAKFLLRRPYFSIKAIFLSPLFMVMFYSKIQCSTFSF